jgi:5-methylcytosine-specific restriction endonuclease McrA
VIWLLLCIVIWHLADRERGTPVRSFFDLLPLRRVPTVIVALNFAKVPKKCPTLCARTIRERDCNRCQYTGKLLRPDEGSIDHVLPRSWGGKGEWGNLVWSDKTVNAKKANRLPQETGLKLLAILRRVGPRQRHVVLP